MDTCKHWRCKKEYDRKQLKRSLGEESMVYQLGYCSAFCYTERSNLQQKEDLKEPKIHTNVSERVEKGLCYVCGEKAKHSTVVGSVYLCDNEQCWVEACREEFIDGMNEMNQE